MPPELQIGAAILSIVSSVIYSWRKVREAEVQAQKTHADAVAALIKRADAAEAERDEMEAERDATRSELAKSKDRERALAHELSDHARGLSAARMPPYR